MKAYITIGLPASGKSTWAKEKVAETSKMGASAFRINNDDIRNGIYADLGHRQWSKKIEKLVDETRTIMLRDCAADEQDVIVDNTHMNPYTFESIQKQCTDLGFEVEVVDFRHVSVEECIRRDALREGHERVGEDVIRRMARKGMMEQKYPDRETLPDSQNTGKPKCIIVDIDGTLAQMSNRSPYDETKVYNDNVREFVLATVKALTIHPLTSGKSVKLFIFSGRTDTCEKDTRLWLKDKCGLHSSTYTLAMRKTGDRRRDSEVKRDIYMELVDGKYDVLAVFDDRAQVIRELWADLKLPVFRCGVIDKDDF